jgi:hypothetical protein
MFKKKFSRRSVGKMLDSFGYSESEITGYPHGLTTINGR